MTTSMQVAVAFDGIADSYDSIFTNTPIGRAQRGAVWSEVRRVFKSGDRVLELNCGTGEDALYLARLGVQVVACDASPGMLSIARRRHSDEGPELPITFHAIPTERICELNLRDKFDGVFSNFSGLNCVNDLERAASDLSSLTRPGAHLMLCLSSRICAWELLWYLARLQPSRALRRLRGQADVRVEGKPVRVWYPTVRQVQLAFAPSFRLREISAVGLFVPPSYAARLFEKFPRVLRAAESADRAVGHLPLLRVLGDHVLLHFERSEA